MSSKPTIHASDIYRRLHIALLNCEPFISDRELQAVFVDERISLWANTLPQADSVDSRVSLVVNYLSKQYNDRRESALILFLRVLRDRIPVGDLRHREVAELADKLEVWFQSLATSSVTSIPSEEQVPASETLSIRQGMAPPLPPLVVGREEALSDLKDRLTLAHSQSKVATQALTVVTGWPGVGKTTIATAIAHDPDIIRAFPDGVLWTSLGLTPNLFAELAAWGRAFGIDDLLKARTLEEISARLRALLPAILIMTSHLNPPAIHGIVKQ